MKAVRLMLADNTDLAKEALVSKSQLENEAYLFKAACAELSTEVTTRRRSEQEKMRTERTQLQHEVDILSQSLSQQSGTLKEELKGLFDDRKMAVRNEQRDMESKIQQLNYKITVMLQADAKSEVEGLRWLMTRRVILTLAAVVIMAVGGLKLIADAMTRDAEEARRVKELGAPSFVDAERRVLPQEMVVKEGDNPGFVSLG
jgi:phage shock protein A